jgi:ABC-type oligopeptide transport system substrate-binding subunit
MPNMKLIKTLLATTLTLTAAATFAAKADHHTHAQAPEKVVVSTQEQPTTQEQPATQPSESTDVTAASASDVAASTPVTSN